MLAKVFKIDVTECDSCGGEMQKICAVNDGDSIRRYLLHLGPDPDPPGRTKPSVHQAEILFQSRDWHDEIPDLVVDEPSTFVRGVELMAKSHCILPINRPNI